MESTLEKVFALYILITLVLVRNSGWNHPLKISTNTCVPQNEVRIFTDNGTCACNSQSSSNLQPANGSQWLSLFSFLGGCFISGVWLYNSIMCCAVAVHNQRESVYTTCCFYQHVLEQQIFTLTLFKKVHNFLSFTTINDGEEKFLVRWFYLHFAWEWGMSAG